VSRATATAAVGIAVVLALAGCSAMGEDELIAQAHSDFDALVEDAAAVDVSVLHTLEVEEAVSTSCDEDSDAEHTVFVAAGTIAVQATLDEWRDLVETLAPQDDSHDAPRWSEIDGLPPAQRAYVDANGITAAVGVEDGLLVITVFSPCTA
jgi:hypothetical protein